MYEWKFDLRLGEVRFERPFRAIGPRDLVAAIQGALPQLVRDEIARLGLRWPVSSMLKRTADSLAEVRVWDFADRVARLWNRYNREELPLLPRHTATPAAFVGECIKRGILTRIRSQ